jgi:hypothetical protein
LEVCIRNIYNQSFNPDFKLIPINPLGKTPFKAKMRMEKVIAKALTDISDESHLTRNEILKKCGCFNFQKSTKTVGRGSTYTNRK